MIETSKILAVGGLILAAKIWVDVCDLLKQNMKMKTYTKFSGCAVDILKILQEESKKKKIKVNGCG